jgi:hypothetical protein
MEHNNPNPETIIHNERLANLYTLNKTWLSEINFLDDEMKFMSDLLDKFFINLIQEEHINRIQLIKMQLVTLGMVRKNIKQDILRHQVNIEEKINNVSSKSDGFLELEDERMGDELADLQKNFKHVKSEIFNISRAILQNKKTPAA